MNFHFRHKKFLVEVNFEEVQITPTQMAKISTFIQRFHVSCPWTGKLLQIVCWILVFFKIFTIHDFPLFWVNFTRKKNVVEINKKRDFCNSSNSSHFKDAEKWGAKPLIFLPLYNWRFWTFQNSVFFGWFRQRFSFVWNLPKIRENHEK